MRKSGKSLVYIGASFILIVFAIAATAFFNRSSQSSSAADLRAKAGVTSSLKMTGAVSSVDIGKGVLVVGDLRFASSEQPQNLGVWTVTPPPEFTLATASPGATVTITIDPQTFLAATHTVTATRIIVER